MSRPLMIDLFCGGGGVGMGYYRAGWDVIGIDLKPMPRYPFDFIQADAIEFLDRLIRDKPTGFEAIHASPPCQHYSLLSYSVPGTRFKYPDLIEPIRDRFQMIDHPWVIENVVRAPLLDPLMLCGSMFGLGYDDLQLRRHRLFETSFEISAPGSCDHSKKTFDPYTNAARKRFRKKYNIGMCTTPWKQAMGISWLSGKELSEAVPPAYAEYIGGCLMRTQADYVHAA